MQLGLSLAPGPCILWASGDCEALLGFTSTAISADIRYLSERLHPDDQELLSLWLSAAVKPQDRESPEGHLRFRHADGQYRILFAQGEWEPSDSALRLVLCDVRDLPTQLSGLDSDLVTVMMETTDDFIFFKDNHHVLLAASQSMTALCEPIENWRDFAGKIDYEVFSEAVTDQYYDLEARVYAGEDVAREVQPAQRTDGTSGWVDNRKYPIRDERGRIIGLYGIARDITDRVEAVSSRRLAASVFEHTNESIVIVGPNGRVRNVNRSFAEASGLRVEEVIGCHLSKVWRALDGEEAAQLRWDILRSTGEWRGEIETERPNGERCIELVRFSSTQDDEGRLLWYVGIYTDITSLKRHEKELERAANFDDLTGLANRSLFGDRIQKAIATAHRSGQYLAVAYIDLDGFKLINDTSGHAAGDDFLITVSKAMSEALREVDTLARVGGDEFVALITGLDDPDGYQPVATRLMKAVSVARDTSGSHGCTASIGVARFPMDGRDADHLLRHADQAMYAAKRQGKSTQLAFSVGAGRVDEGSEDLTGGLERGEFELHYQPKVHLGSGELIGMEALLRWRHPKRGLLLPGDFLPAVDRENLVIPFGNWVLDEAVRQITAWQRLGLEMQLSVNIAAMHIQRQEFLEDLSERLRRSTGGTRPTLLLEVLESSAMGNAAEMTQIMRDMQRLHVDFALDDFGTGFSSLTHLRQLPVKEVKIDLSFVRDMLTDEEDHSIVASIIGLCAGLGRRVVAEGVSSDEHARALLALGCEYGQGFVISRAMPAAEVPQWLERWRRDKPWTRFTGVPKGF